MRCWESGKGVEFLKQVGISKGDAVLDFGCRVGHYTIPAAHIVGSEGIVYAIDNQEDVLAELEAESRKQNLINIRTIKTCGQLNLPLENESIDVALFYDVLHYIGKSDRKKLYQEVFRILKKDGLLSIYPKHTLEDDPRMEFKDVGLEMIMQEIQDSDFVFNEKHCGILSHDDSLTQACVFNFIKDKQKE